MGWWGGGRINSHFIKIRISRHELTIYRRIGDACMHQKNYHTSWSTCKISHKNRNQRSPERQIFIWSTNTFMLEMSCAIRHMDYHFCIVSNMIRSAMIFSCSMLSFLDKFSCGLSNNLYFEECPPYSIAMWCATDLLMRGLFFVKIHSVTVWLIQSHQWVLTFRNSKQQ